MQKLISLLRNALKGEHRDYTQGNISEAVVLLAIPMILEIGLESVFAVVDMFFVSHLGPNAIATVGLTEAVITLVYSMGIGISAGATAIVARRIGEKNPEAASHAGAQAILLATVVSIVISIIGIVFSGDILALMGATDEVVREGAIFGRVLLGGNIVILLIFLINGIFRGAGDAAMAMRSLWLASAINIVLCPIFIHYFGLKGAAMATVCGRAAGVAYQCWHLFKGDGNLKFRVPHFSFDFPLIKSIVAISWPATMQYLIGSGSWIVLTRLVAETGGTNASAGYQIAFRIFVFFILPAWGLSNAAATLVGQNLGAKHPERAEQSVITTAKFSMVLMTLVTIFLVSMAGILVRFFTQDEAVLQHGVVALRIIASGFIFYGVAIVLAQALNGAGDTKSPTRFNIVCFWVFQLPLAYFLTKGLNWGPAGAMVAIPVSQALFAYVAWRYFKKGRWKTMQV